MLRRVVVAIVDTHHYGPVLALAGAEMITFLAPASRCLGLRRIGEETGGLDHDIRTDLTPRKGGGARSA